MSLISCAISKENNKVNQMDRKRINIMCIDKREKPTTADPDLFTVQYIFQVTDHAKRHGI